MTTNRHLDSARDWADIAVKQKAEINELKAKLSRYESLDASAPILDAASVAEFAGLARSVAASHERLRAQLESVEADKNRALQGEMKALRDAERDTAERIAAWVSSGSHCGSLIGENMAARIREGAWKAECDFAARAKSAASRVMAPPPPGLEDDGQVWSGKSAAEIVEPRPCSPEFIDAMRAAGARESVTSALLRDLERENEK